MKIHKRGPHPNDVKHVCARKFRVKGESRTDLYDAMKAERDALREVAIEAHSLIVFSYQSFMKPPSQTDGRYEESMFIWNLGPKARELMTGCEQELFDALMKARAALDQTGGE